MVCGVIMVVEWRLLMTVLAGLLLALVRMGWGVSYESVPGNLALILEIEFHGEAFVNISRESLDCHY